MPPPRDSNRGAWIAPDADRELGRAAARLAVRALALWLAVMVAAWLLYSAVPAARSQTPLIGLAATLLIVLPVLVWLKGMYRTVIAVGRHLLEQGRVAEAATALDTFTRFGNRSFDTDGEAHYLLATAYARLGEVDKARDAAGFVVRQRPRSRWREPAERLWTGGGRPKKQR